MRERGKSRLPLKNRKSRSKRSRRTKAVGKKDRVVWLRSRRSISIGRSSIKGWLRNRSRRGRITK